MIGPGINELLIIVLILVVLLGTFGGVVYLAVRLATRGRTQPPPPEGRPSEE